MEKTMESILNQIKVVVSDTLDQQNLFTPYHRKYKVIMKYNGHQFSCTYQCNVRFTPNVNDIIECIISDMYSYDNTTDMEDFAMEFGYELYDEYPKYNKETERIYKACKRTSEAMHKMFTDTELEMLSDELNGLY